VALPSAWRANARPPRHIEGVVSDCERELAAVSLCAAGVPVSDSSKTSQPRAACQSGAGPAPKSSPPGEPETLRGSRAQREYTTTGAPPASGPASASNGTDRGATGSVSATPACQRTSVQRFVAGRGG
jgi:hypothetical protein